MPNLLEQLTKGLSTQQPAAPAPQQKQAQDILQAKSGKATTTTAGGPAASSLAENQVISQANKAGEQLRLQGVATANALREADSQAQEQVRQDAAKLDAQQRTFEGGMATQAANVQEEIASREEQVLNSLSAEEMRKTDAINNSAQNKLKELATQRHIAVEDIFSTLEQSNKELRFRKDAAQLEQYGFLMSLQDQAYVDEIQAVAKEQSLMDEMAYKEEMLQITLGQEFATVMDQIGFREVFNARDRVNQEQLGKIDINAALAIANAETQAANNQAIVQGTIDAGKAGIDWWAKNSGDKSPDGYTNEPDDTGPGGQLGRR